jgi:hypothetical protein
MPVAAIKLRRVEWGATGAGEFSLFMFDSFQKKMQSKKCVPIASGTFVNTRHARTPDIRKENI